MIKTTGYAAQHAGAKLALFEFEHRDLGAQDVLIEILYCGVCHSDVHQARGDWGNKIFPMVPGHEIVGRISRVGAEVKRYKVGDYAGVGCMVDSCRQCASCQENLEQFCEEGFTATYNSLERGRGTPT
ncbi:MAG: alcohol dehydrogenase catalytic domain-containing protein, partial [Gammaproteobacteria bacterium]|nr:alcohol dehydrogenase catalytic domain-containing protein [Gammaproteobacteria bacterium]